MFQVDGAACAMAGGRKEPGTFKNAKEVCVAGMQEEGSGGRRETHRGHVTEGLEKPHRAAKELAFLPQAMGTHWRTGSNRKGLGHRRGLTASPALSRSLLMSGCHFPIFFFPSECSEREGERVYV